MSVIVECKFIINPNKFGFMLHHYFFNVKCRIRKGLFSIIWSSSSALTSEQNGKWLTSYDENSIAHCLRLLSPTHAWLLGKKRRKKREKKEGKNETKQRKINKDKKERKKERINHGFRFLVLDPYQFLAGLIWVQYALTTLLHGLSQQGYDTPILRVSDV